MCCATTLAIWDLEGTIVDTRITNGRGIRDRWRLLIEIGIVQTVDDVARCYGRSLPSGVAETIKNKSLGEIIAQLKNLGIQTSTDQLMEKLTSAIKERMENVPLMPGALRLLKYFQRQSIQMVLIYGSGIGVKSFLEARGLLAEKCFAEKICRDEFKEKDPCGEIFLLAAERMGTAPEECIVFDDSASGIPAVIRAGMRVVWIPSHDKDASARKEWENHASVEVIASLMDFNPALYRLSPFDDIFEGVIEMNPVIYLNGTVVKGFGRGAKDLGIRTANIDHASLSLELSAAVTGIYAGWAKIEGDEVIYPMVMSIGWNPFYKLEKRTAEAWILHEFPEDFYGVNLRLLATGYLRPEADFTTLENLKAQIFEDRRQASVYLESPSASAHKADSRLGAVV